MYSVLLLHADGTQALPMAEELHSMGCSIHGVFVSRWSYGYASRYIDKRFIVPCKMADIDAYYRYLSDLINQIHYDVVIPLNDESAELLSKYRESLLTKVRFVMPDYTAFTRAYNKQNLMAYCKKNNFPHPETYKDEEIGKICQNLPYPMLIKPNITCGARGMTLCKDSISLRASLPMVQLEYGACHVQRFILEGGAQVEVQLYIDANQQLKHYSVIRKYRWYPERGGSSCFNVSECNEEVVQMLYRLLKGVGWIGFADFDLIEDPTTGELLVMELNPRVPACLRTAVKSGINWPRILLHEYLELPYDEKPEYKRVYLKHFGFEVLWFLQSKNRYKSRPSIFRLLGEDMYYQDANMRDPFPFIVGTLGNLFKLFSASFRRSKAGTRNI